MTLDVGLWWHAPTGRAVQVGTGMLGPDWSGGFDDGFVVGVTRPVGGVNVGDGVIRSAPAVVLTPTAGASYDAGSSTWTISGPITDRIIDGYVTLTATGSLENCYCRGPVAQGTVSRPVVLGPNTGTVAVDVRFTTIRPQAPSSYLDGIGRKNINAHRVWVDKANDAVAAFSPTLGPVNSRYEGCLFTNLTQWRPDVAGSRAETHNDDIQFQGSNQSGNADDCVLIGCELNARHSTDTGTTPPTRTQISAVMLNANVAGSVIAMTIDQCWLLGGMYTVNALADPPSGSVFVLTNNRMERPNWPGNDGLDPDGAIGAHANWNVAGRTWTQSGNTYIDNGAAVPSPF